MNIHLQSFTVHKRVPLTISRGTTTATTNLWLQIQADEIEGWGEASPFSVGDRHQTTLEIQQHLQELALVLTSYHPLERQAIARQVARMEIPSAAQAALDLALHDWLGKRLGLPLWQLWGLDREQIPPTSVTIGLSSPDAAQQRFLDWLQLTPIRAIKVKLGHPQGIAADRAILQAVLQLASAQTQISVDANGGWTLEAALQMGDWLAERGVAYVEQPLARGQEQELLPLRSQFPLPIFVDESCWTSADIPPLMDRVDGINIKLMKSGGLSAAMGMIHTARACGLKVMLGCYSDSTLANTALAHLSPLADYIDLDSHLNLRDDPFTGALLQGGRLWPNDQPGLGVQYHGTHA